jgi:putative endopeptidase
MDAVFKQTSLAEMRAYLTARWYESIPVLHGFGDPSPELAGLINRVCGLLLTTRMSDAIEPRFLELAGVDARAQAKARALYRAIANAFEEELKTAAFLDLPTRVEAQMKLSKMRAAIGGSRSLDDFRNVPIDGGDTFAVIDMRLREHAFDRGLAQVGKRLPLLHVDFAAPTVNASFSGVLNKITIPGGILGGYFFSASAPAFANFAGIGTVLGHELTHGFDDNGRLRDGDGTFRDWWSHDVGIAFEQRSQCLVDQYSAFTLEGVADPATGAMPAHIDGKLTLGENIADNGGLKLAYRASKVEGLSTPVAFGFTPAQQFFIGYGQLWCGKSSPENASAALADDVHSPQKARVNLTLANFDAFATAFQCKPGASMAPANRCAVW